MSREDALNVLGTALVPCSYDPLTGWYRDGCCHTDDQDAGSHVICARMTMAFLNFQFERGNDLITPRPELRFRGLKPGDRWCVCALRDSRLGAARRAHGRPPAGAAGGSRRISAIAVAISPDTSVMLPGTIIVLLVRASAP